jgi:N-acetylneuraminate synthase
MKPLVIAEAGVNHNGDLGLALELVDAAAAAGADVVKFQTFRSSELATATAPKADYQRVRTTAEELQSVMLARLELDEHAHHELMRRCEQRGIEFLSTAFDLPSLELLIRLGLQRFKIPSGEIHNGPLLMRIASAGKPIILSTGMCTLDDVEAGLGLLTCALSKRNEPKREELAHAWRSRGSHLLGGVVTLLHCTSEYPAPIESINLAAMDTLRRHFGLSIGYSDHSLGITVPIAATALGATVIEKHLTLDRRLPGPDHAASLEPDEFRSMVTGIRVAASALGTPEKKPSATECANAAVVRKSLVALRPIARGEPFSPANLGIKRPGNGISSLYYWEYLGRPARRDYSADEQIDS